MLRKAEVAVITMPDIAGQTFGRARMDKNGSTDLVTVN